MTKSSTPLDIPADHPALEGHFPGDPVVPATVLLEAVHDAVRARHPGYRLRTLSHAKFLSPLRPGQTGSIEIDTRENIVRFRCLRGTDIIAMGEIILIAED